MADAEYRWMRVVSDRTDLDIPDVREVLVYYALLGLAEHERDRGDDAVGLVKPSGEPTTEVLSRDEARDRFNQGVPEFGALFVVTIPYRVDG
jgi:hypothetical protein